MRIYFAKLQKSTFLFEAFYCTVIIKVQVMSDPADN